MGEPEAGLEENTDEPAEKKLPRCASLFVGSCVELLPPGAGKPQQDTPSNVGTQTISWHHSFLCWGEGASSGNLHVHR